MTKEDYIMIDFNKRNGNSYNIYDWMMTKLDLTCSGLFVYAKIYDTSSKGKDFIGSINYLRRCTNTSKSTVIRVLKDLVEKGYIIKAVKQIDGKDVVTYRHNEEILKEIGVN